MNQETTTPRRELVIRGTEAFDGRGRRLGLVDRVVLDADGEASVSIRDDEGHTAICHPTSILCETADEDILKEFPDVGSGSA